MYHELRKRGASALAGIEFHGRLVTQWCRSDNPGTAPPLPSAVSGKGGALVVFLEPRRPCSHSHQDRAHVKRYVKRGTARALGVAAAHRPPSANQ